MERKETINLITEILESIEHFEDRIERMEWSNEFGKGQEMLEVYLKNRHGIHICRMCIDRLNERFTKQLNTLK